MIAGGNPKRYFVASQFSELRERARKVPGTPVLYLHDCTPTLEQPSEASVKSAEETVRKKIRRRGNTVVTEPTIANTNEHNEYGLVEPERPQPFRSPFSDVFCVADRCNDDVRIMARGFPEDGDIEKHVITNTG